MLTARFAIIGGGLSGLHAARLLAQRGESFVLLEARPQLGGRVLPLTLPGQSRGGAAGRSLENFDLGATWFWPGLQHGLQQLIDDLGLPTFPQPETGDWMLERSRLTQPGRVSGYPSSPPSTRLMGGMSSLVAALSEGVPADSIRLSHQVTSIALAGDHIEVASVVGGKVVTFSVEHVLLALPPRLAAQTIRFTPSLPERTHDAWSSTPTWMAPHAKYLAVYESPFWRDEGLAGAAHSTVGPMVEMHDASTPDGRGAIFGFIGVPAQVRASVPHKDLLGACRAQLVRLFGPRAGQPMAETIQDWAREPFTATDQDQIASGHASAPSTSVSQGPWQGRLIGIASEWSPEFPGYVAGAIDAAERGIRIVEGETP